MVPISYTTLSPGVRKAVALPSDLGSSPVLQAMELLYPGLVKSAEKLVARVQTAAATTTTTKPQYAQSGYPGSKVPPLPHAPPVPPCAAVSLLPSAADACALLHQQRVYHCHAPDMPQVYTANAHSTD
jgi:hypothetical protein